MLHVNEVGGGGTVSLLVRLVDGVGLRRYKGC